MPLASQRLASRKPAVIGECKHLQAERFVRFGLGGTEYEIDLNAGHAQALRDALDHYVLAALRAWRRSIQQPARGGRKKPGAQRGGHH
jgi:Lsr2